jgi:AcrR family transcriptional regulator
VARQVKEYDERYQQFLDVGQQLFYTKGYDHTSIQEIIDAVGVAKGLFYYYFHAKGDLLDAIIARSLAQRIEQLTPLVDDPAVAAPAKFVRLFADLGNWKLAKKEFFLEVMRVTMRDENVLLRTKMRDLGVTAVAPLMARVIEQGVGEGVFAVDQAADIAELLLEMGQSLSRVTTDLLLSTPATAEAYNAFMRKVDAYERSIERVLGAQPGSLPVMPREQIRMWLE